MTDEINIVSGGSAVCLACGARLRKVTGVCPECKQPLTPGSFRLVPASKAQKKLDGKRRARTDP